MPEMPSHLRHAQHVGAPHPDCLVCQARAQQRVGAARPQALTVSADSVQVRLEFNRHDFVGGSYSGPRFVR